MLATPPTATVPSISADEIHRQLVSAFRLGNRARLRFCRLLAALADSRLFLKLGHPSVAQYAERRFGVGRSESFEMIRVASVIDERPELSQAFVEGRLAWTSLKQITRVATAETEHAWLTFADERTAAELRAEVRDAVEKKRTAPRADRFGLPNLNVRFAIELTAEEHERLRAALEKAGAEIAARLESRELPPKDVVLYVVERFLRTDPDGTPDGRRPSEQAPYALVYHRCPDCRRARVHTGDGPVEVPGERVAAVASAADREFVAEEPVGDVAAPIDRPNPPALARRVKLRDGGRCRNPGCGSRGPLHAHHIEHRAAGGRTIASNEVAVCTTCHALIHAGLLMVGGDPFERLDWRARSETLPVPAADDSREDADVIRITSAIADSAALKPDSARSCRTALERLGFPAARARREVDRACAETRSDDVETLLTYVLRTGG